MDFYKVSSFMREKITMKLEAKCGEFQPRDRCREVSRGAKQKSFCGKNLWIITLDPLGEETFLS